MFFTSVYDASKSCMSIKGPLIYRSATGIARGDGLGWWLCCICIRNDACVSKLQGRPANDLT